MTKVQIAEQIMTIEELKSKIDKVSQNGYKPVLEMTEEMYDILKSLSNEINLADRTFYGCHILIHSINESLEADYTIKFYM